MTRYAIGRRLEYLVRDELIEQGYYVVRAAGSKGKIDLVAWNGYQFILIQVKKGKIATKDEIAALKKLKKPRNASIELWQRVNNKWDVKIIQKER